ncbi:YihY/virulence factor BrkB family protein [Sphingomonas radiodurans]|uniref:YihY/virulence factor BrkB family protein n=1 Tax=Sphingomonas radiodurans TaxID=2890321 RepID=UPI001E54437F|nr:YihY/virulence factor BrkB family protein [Sphingomonas radiodurans]WBH18159.1 YihY/virulence factor BrkB family protein [Sphingomonas radiodurans]
MSPPAPDAATHGRDAASPMAIPAAGWKQIALRSWREAGQDNISLIASGVAFCAVLAIVPMLGAIVLSYGLVATPETVLANVQSLAAMMPTDVAKLIGEQLANVVSTADGKKGFGLLIALAIAFYGAMKGATAIITSLNIAYDEEETRGFVKLNLVALGITAGAVVLALLAMITIAAMAGLEALFPGAPGFLLVLSKILSYVIMTAIGAAAAATLYRYAPNRDQATWTWLSPGSLLASVGWMIMTLGFGLYVANFGSYDATYGSLGAAIVLLTWLYLSAYVLLLGAEFNCELERQTARDTTTGVERPLGERGAFAADTVAGSDAPVAAPPRATRDSNGLIENYAASRTTARVAARAGAGKIGAPVSILATLGLALIRRRDRRAIGSVLLLAAGGISLLGNTHAQR